jgi:predicted dehydrogenase
MLRRNALPVRDGFLMSKHSGGGACIDIGVHVLDLTLWFMGNPEPKSVTGVARTELAKDQGAFSKMGDYNHDVMDVEELAAAFIRFENGAVLMLEVSWMLHHEAGEFEDMQVWLYGKKGGLHWPSCQKLTSDSNSKSHSNSIMKPQARSIEPHAQECVEFSEAIINDLPVPVPAEHSLQVMKILNAVYLSEKTGKEVLL